MSTRRFKLGVAGICLAAVAISSSAAEDAALTDFGFTGPEIYPIDRGVMITRSADVDGDGLLDVLVVNNGRAKINVLYNRTGKPLDPEAAKVKRELNELPPDARFKIDSIASEKRISAFDVKDLNGDGKPDIVYYGEPKELVIQYNEGDNNWSQPKKIAITDGQSSPNGLTVGDLNGDKLPDIALLAEGHFYVLYQQKDHTLSEPVKMATTGTVKSLQALDIDGNGRDDLLLVNWDNANPFRFRLQDETGKLGPEIHFEFPAVRSYWAEDLDGDHKTEIITIALKSGRAQIGNFQMTEAPVLLGKLRAGQLSVLPLNRTTKARRGIAWADLNDDKRTDLVVAEPDSGELSVQLQSKNGTMGPVRNYPTLSGISDLAVADWDDDGRNDLFMLSVDERQIGVATMDENGRIAFPKRVPLADRPLVMAAGPLLKNSKPVLAAITDNSGKRTLVWMKADGTSASQELSEQFRANPSSMTLHDVNQDGRMDLVVMIPYEKIKFLLQKEDGKFEEVDLSPPGGSADQPWLSRADVDGDGKPELLLAQNNFVRAVTVVQETLAEKDAKPQWAFAVKDQINGMSASSKIAAATALQPEGSKSTLLFLFDSANKVVSVCERDDAGVWQVRRNISLPVTDFNELQAVALGSKKPNTVSLVGLNTVAWMALDGNVWELAELDGYETPIKDGYLRDIVSGDLNQDDRQDLVFLETTKNHVDLVVFSPEGKLVPANRWKVFEERTFRGMPGATGEPREALIEDFNGDGKNDLMLLVHDRLLLYIQE